MPSDPLPAPRSSQTGDAESKKHRNLGVGGSADDGPLPSPFSDPMKAARQAIRSQVTAREYTETQLAHAQTTIQDLRTRLRHVHHEREAAIGAAQSAMTAKANAERTLAAADAVLAQERATRIRTEAMLRDAEATIRDLREKLAAQRQSMQVEMAAERLNRQSDDALRPAAPAHEITALPIRDAAVPTVRRPVGGPRKTDMVQPVQTSTMHFEPPQGFREDGTPTIQDAADPTIRRPVGRRRKVAVMKPVEKATRDRKSPQASAETVIEKADMAEPKAQSRTAANEEPVQWWIDGWKRR
jgi:hypothetical protein